LNYNETEKTESGKERFVKNIMAVSMGLNTNTPWDKEYHTIDVKYYCDCGHEYIEQVESIQPFAKPVKIECDDCIKKREDEKRCNDYLSMIPKRYRVNMVFDGEPKLLTEECSLIYGNYGTGKTWTAYAIARELYLSMQINTFQIVREAQLLHSIRESQYRRFEECDLLVIDEFGKGSDTEFAKAEIFNIIDLRYDEMRKTILICNAKDKEELKKAVSFAVLDRYRNNIVFLDGKSRRWQ
jgi:hypothetical protein